MPALARILPALALTAALLSGCARDEMVNETMDEVTALTAEVTTLVKEGEDKKAAIAEAKALIESRQGELRPKLEKISQLRGFQVSQETVDKFRAQLTASMLDMTTLQLELVMETAQDPELAKQLEELLAAHDALLDLQ